MAEIEKQPQEPMAKPKKRGGVRPNSGRKKGKVSAVKLNIAAEARQYGLEAIAVLAAIMRDEAEKSRERLAAASYLLDRGYGKPLQELRHEGADGGLPKVVVELVSEPAADALPAESGDDIDSDSGTLPK